MDCFYYNRVMIEFGRKGGFFMNQTVNVLGVSFQHTTLHEAAETLSGILDQERQPTTFQVVTANPEMVMFAKKNRKYKVILNQADMTVADGIGIVLGAKYLRTPLPERVTGFDTVSLLLRMRNTTEKKTRVFCLGASEEVITKATETIQQEYPHIDIVGKHHGYFEANSEEEKAVVQQIAAAQPDLLLVGMGLEKQETFIYTYKSKLQAKIAIGVGGTFDVLSGKTKRSPELFQKLHLEWFWRLCSEPSRWKRQLNLPLFVLAVMKSKKQKQ